MTCVTLRGGLIVRADILARVVRMEMDGLTFRLEDGRIMVAPREAVTPEDAACLRASRWQVLALVGYEAPA